MRKTYFLVSIIALTDLYLPLTDSHHVNSVRGIFVQYTTVQHKKYNIFDSTEHILE